MFVRKKNKQKAPHVSPNIQPAQPLPYHCMKCGTDLVDKYAPCKCPRAPLAPAPVNTAQPAGSETTVFQVAYGYALGAQRSLDEGKLDVAKERLNNALKILDARIRADETAALTQPVNTGPSAEAVVIARKIVSGLKVHPQTYKLWAQILAPELLRALEASASTVVYLERQLHNTLHRLPKPDEDCAQFCYITFHKYPDGTYGHTCGGSLEPREALNAVYPSAHLAAAPGVKDIVAERVPRVSNVGDDEGAVLTWSDGLKLSIANPGVTIKQYHGLVQRLERVFKTYETMWQQADRNAAENKEIKKALTAPAQPDTLIREGM